MRHLSLSLFIALAMVGSACKDAPEAPEGAAPGELTFYGGFAADIELYEEVLRSHIASAQTYLDEIEAGEHGDDCFRFEYLNPSDTASVGMWDTDPSAIPSVVQATVFDYPVVEMEEAILATDWAEVYVSTFEEYVINSETDIDAYRSGDSHYYERNYNAVIEVAGALISYVSNNQYRRIDDWDGTGQPLAVLRGWLPNGANSDTSSTTVSMIFKIELLVPIEGGAKTMRLATTWSDLSMGLDDNQTFAIGCISLNNAMGDLEDWVSDNAQQ